MSGLFGGGNQGGKKRNSKDAKGGSNPMLMLDPNIE